MNASSVLSHPADAAAPFALGFDRGAGSDYSAVTRVFICGMCETEAHSPTDAPPVGWDVYEEAARFVVTCPDCNGIVEERHANRMFSRGMVDARTRAGWRDAAVDRLGQPVLPRAPWMTASGRIVDLLNPQPADFDIEDIAAALSKVCRFGGTSKRFYSVAEHSVLVSRRAPAGHKLAALLHDAAEAYLGDVVSPLKALLPDYRAIEARFDLAIGERFGVDIATPEVKSADVALCVREAEVLMPTDPAYWGTARGDTQIAIDGWAPEDARHRFMLTFLRLGGVA